MRKGWKQMPYNSTRREVGPISMGTSYGMRGERHTASCSAFSIRLTGFESHEEAQEAVEKEAAKRARSFLAALESEP